MEQLHYCAYYRILLKWRSCITVHSAGYYWNGAYNVTCVSVSTVLGLINSESHNTLTSFYTSQKPCWAIMKNCSVFAPVCVQLLTLTAHRCANTHTHTHTFQTFPVFLELPDGLQSINSTEHEYTKYFLYSSSQKHGALFPDYSAGQCTGPQPPPPNPPVRCPQNVCWQRAIKDLLRRCTWTAYFVVDEDAYFAKVLVDN